MKKLTLDLEALGVDSFQTDTGAQGEAGTGAEAMGITRWCTYTCP